MEISLLISVIGVSLSIATFFIGRTTASKNSGKEYGQMLSEIGYIRRGLDEVKDDVRSIRKESTEIRIEHARHKEDIEDLRRRVGELEKKMSRYHEGGTK